MNDRGAGPHERGVGEGCDAPKTLVAAQALVRAGRCFSTPVKNVASRVHRSGHGQAAIWQLVPAAEISCCSLGQLCTFCCSATQSSDYGISCKHQWSGLANCVRGHRQMREEHTVQQAGGASEQEQCGSGRREGEGCIRREGNGDVTGARMLCVLWSAAAELWSQPKPLQQPQVNVLC